MRTVISVPSIAAPSGRMYDTMPPPLPARRRPALHPVFLPCCRGRRPRRTRHAGLAIVESPWRGAWALWRLPLPAVRAQPACSACAGASPECPSGLAPAAGPCDAPPADCPRCRAGAAARRQRRGDLVVELVVIYSLTAPPGSAPPGDAAYSDGACRCSRRCRCARPCWIRALLRRVCLAGLRRRSGKCGQSGAAPLSWAQACF